MDRRRLVRRVAVAILVLAAATGAGTAVAQNAGSASATMDVSLEVLPNCTLTAGSLAFGTLTAEAAPVGEATASIEVSCGPAVPFTVALDDGRNPGDGTRRVFDAARGRYVAYDIFADAGHSQRWGGGGAQTVSGVTPSAGSVRLTAYGLIGDEAQLSEGSYSDAVTVTMVF